MKIAFFSSHNGSAMRTIHAAANAKGHARLDAHICLLIVNKPEVPARAWAEAHDIPCTVINDKEEGAEAADARARDALRAHAPDLIILGGYLRKIGPLMLAAFAPRILNIHPSLLPDFGGKGMYGLRVHSGVIDSGAKESGGTIHIVNSEYDRGPIVAQGRVPILPNDTPEQLQKRVLAAENQLVIETVRDIAAGRINLSALSALSAPSAPSA